MKHSQRYIEWDTVGAFLVMVYTYIKHERNWRGSDRFRGFKGHHHLFPFLRDRTVWRESRCTDCTDDGWRIPLSIGMKVREIGNKAEAIVSQRKWIEREREREREKRNQDNKIERRCMFKLPPLFISYLEKEDNLSIGKAATLPIDVESVWEFLL
jgi:hypothetical protein